MSAKRTVLAALLVSFMLAAGCLLVPHRGRGGVSFVPLLPSIVELGEEAYYVHEGYHFHYRNDGWYYSRSRRGPWSALPRDHYPREVRFKQNKGNRDRGRNSEHHRR